MRKYVCILMFMLTLLPLHAQKSITGSTDKKSYMVGDAVTYTFSVPNGNRQLNISSDFTFSDTIQLVDTKTDTSADKITYNYTLVSFVEGTHKLPEFQFYAPADTVPLYNVSSPTIEITVPVIDTVNIEVKPLKNIIKVPLTLKEILPFSVIGLVLAGIIVAVVYFVRHKDRRPKILQPKPEVIIPEDEEALSNLNRLKQARLLETGQEKQHYIVLSEILWQYIYRRFDVNAFEMTTSQIMDSMQGKEASVEDKEKLNNIFSTSDLVKFAKYIPDTKTNLTLLQDSEDFIKHCKHIIIEENNESADGSKDKKDGEDKSSNAESRNSDCSAQPNNSASERTKQESEVRNE